MSDAHAEVPGEFRFPGHVVDVRSRQVRRADLASGGGGSRQRPQPAVLLLSRVCDGELEGVRKLLARAGIPSVRLDADELADVGLVVDTDVRALRARGCWLTPTVSWTRHFSSQAIAVSGDLGHDLFVRESWQAAAVALAETAVTRVSLRQTSGGVLSQLRIARLRGIAVPRTIVTTDLAEARDAFSCPLLVVKAVHHHFTEAAPGTLTGRFPVVVEQSGLSGRVRGGAPVIVQEHIEHEAELRIYYLDGRIHGFEIDKASPADLWTAPDRVGVRHVTPPAAVADATRLLAAAMSLRFGAFDFLIRDGSPVFLEVNPDGDWLWAERAARTNVITLGVAQMLANLHRAAIPDGEHTPPLSLLAFLAGPPER